MPSLPFLSFLPLFTVLLSSILSQFAAPPPADHCHHFPDDPMCTTAQNHRHSHTQNSANRCQRQDLWLIPGNADSSCTRPNPKRFAEVNAKQIKILPSVIKLPGCFTVEIRNVRILEGVSRNIFAKTEYQWINAIDTKNEAKCRNASANGCGGFGNDCYYCDICKSLRSIDEEKHAKSAEIPPAIAEQFKRMNCPDKSGVYSFRKEFCLDDWGILDSNNDCQLDFFSSVSPSQSDQLAFQSAMSALQQVGYGTLVAKVRLAYNATPQIEAKKAQKEAQIERTALRELEGKRRTDEWSVNH
ncbi:hypothetical protein niasHS_013261 [Heterodera schachtii]|uniref:DUF7753 domain-containing protein n=1 Tax=Heterodera schachtii TaxID=97005 RepID=A0ABD2IAQ0_HETSC